MAEDNEAVEPITVLVVDDNAIVRSGLCGLLDAADEVRVVGQAWDGEQAIEQARALQPDVVLLDVQMPRRGGISAAPEIARYSRILMMSYRDEPEIVRDAVSAGAAGYLVHGKFDAADLVSSVCAVARGTGVFSAEALSALTSAPAGPAPGPAPVPGLEFGLSERQAEIMELIAAGLSNGQIAARCYLAEKTVKNHVNRIFATLGVRSRAEAVSLWLGGGARAGRI
jgi:DNA-binding NarL/FixJ family response regulator